VRHGNIVEIYDFVCTENPTRVAFVMETLSGRPLSEHIKNGAHFSPTQAVNICIQICDALAAVHNAKVIHRDLKPDNIFVLQDLDSDFSYVPSVKLLDFGIAKQAHGKAAHKTATGMVLGTPAYMAPEQIAGSQPTEKSDVYALALVLYEMLTGNRLFKGEAAVILRQKLLQDTPAISGILNGPSCHQFESVLTWGLERDPKHRPSATDFARGLLEIAPEVVQTRICSAATYLDINALARTPAPNIFHRRLRVTTTTAPRAIPKTEPGDSAIFAAAKSPALKVIGIVSLCMAAALVVMTDRYVRKPKPDKQVLSYTPKPETNHVTPGRKIQPLFIKSTPKHAQVIDHNSGKLLGTTPFPLLLHPQETKEIRLSKRGYMTRVINLTFGQELTAFQLSKRPRPAKLPHAKTKRHNAKSAPAAKTTPSPEQEDGVINKKELPIWN
jgi:hypothetical protein